MTFRKPGTAKNVKLITFVPVGCAWMVQDMVGTIYGETISEVMRFIVINWTTTNIDHVRRARRSRNEYDRKMKGGR